MGEGLTRRRVLIVLAAAGGLPLMARLAPAAPDDGPVVWRGQALGAPAMLVLNHPDRALAQQLVREAVAEVDRLEDMFSLYRPASALNQLNRAGALAAPPRELVEMLDRARAAWQASDGAFDPSIQPLWRLYARHFADPAAPPEGPAPADVAHALAAVDFGAVDAASSRIAFGRPGMALTLNGIAQGHVTDRIVDLLRRAGVTSTLVDMGEPRAIGSRIDGRPWRIGLAETEDAAAGPVLEVRDRAVATSSPIGFRFDPEGRFGHILDPRTGRAAQRYRRVTVVAPDATTADAYSTAFNLMEPDAIRAVVAAHGRLTVDLLPQEGAPSRFGAAI